MTTNDIKVLKDPLSIEREYRSEIVLNYYYTTLVPLTTSTPHTILKHLFSTLSSEIGFKILRLLCS